MGSEGLIDGDGEKRERENVNWDGGVSNLSCAWMLIREGLWVVWEVAGERREYPHQKVVKEAQPLAQFITSAT
jgi:hypothetical protein